MNLIDRYIQHVGKHLPEKSREDVKREIRSLVEDSLEDRSRTIGRPIDEALTVDVLKEFGRPEKMAASYVPERYLINPRMYPIFWLVVRIVMTVLFAIMLVKLFIGITQVDANFVQLIIQTVTGFASGAISALGNIVIVFAIIQYFVPDLSKELDKDDDWDPLKMEKIEDDQELSRFEQVFEITFSVIGLAVFNFFPELLGISFLQNGEWTFLPAFSQAFFSFLPWINILWGAEIVLGLFLLIQGRWQTVTRWVSIGIKAATIILAGFMLTGPALVGLNPQDLVASGAGFTLETATILASLFKQVVTVTLVIIIVLEGFSIARRIYKMSTAAKK